MAFNLNTALRIIQTVEHHGLGGQFCIVLLKCIFRQEDYFNLAAENNLQRGQRSSDWKENLSLQIDCPFY